MRNFFTLLSATLVFVATSISGFSQCDQVTQGDPVANSGCLMCPFPAAGVSGNNSFATPTAGGSWCTSVENDEFIGFTAICNTVQFGIQVSNCAGGTNGDGLQIAVVDADFNLFGCISGVANGSTYSATLPVCGDYYLRLDGVSGSGCDYTITPAAGVLDENFMAPTVPATIAGPTFLCADQSGQYQINAPPGLNSCPGGASICSELCWDISFSSPLLASEVTATPTDAFGFGCTENQVQVVDIAVGDLSSLPPGSTDTIYLSATPDFGCAGPGVQSQVLEIVVSRPPDSFAIVFTCPGEDYFLDGTGYAPGGHVVELFDASGCPFDLNLNVQQYPPNFGPTEPLAVCGLSGVTICPSNPIVDPPAGLNTCNLGPIASNGCDSLIQYDVYYLDPMAVITALDTALDCTQTSVTASVTPGSTQGDTVAYNWTTLGGTFTSNPDNSVITITDSGTYYLEVMMWSDRDPSQTCEARDTLIVTSQASNPLDTPMIVGPLGVCIGSTASYTTASDPTFTAYNWTATGASSSTPSANAFDVVWNTAGTYDVCLTVQNDCETSEQRCIQVVVGNDQPTFTLEGATATCNSGDIALGITPFVPSITYTITGMPTGATAVLDNDTVRVSLASMPGDICITGQGNCGPSTEECVALSINSSAAAPQITGANTACDSASVLYQISADPLITQIEWTITGGTITSATNSIAAVVTWTAGANREICVEITDACGVVQQDCLPVTVSQGPTATIRGGGRYCEGANNLTVEIDLTGQPPFTITYTAGGAAQTASSNTSPIVINTPAPGMYMLTGVSDASNCTGKVSGSATVIEDPLPTAILSGNLDLCANSGDQVSFDVMLTGTGPWTLELALDNAPLTPVTVNTSPYTVTVSTAGTYTVSSLTDATTCTGSGTGSTVVIERQPVSVVAVQDSCLPNNAGFIVIVELSNGDVGSYQNTGSDPGTFSGSTFTSSPLASGSGYSFIFSDQYGCSPQTVTQAVVNCSCNNDAGTMARDTVSLCGPGTITLPATTSGAGAMGEPGDILAFYLHTGAFGSLVGVLDSALTPSFTFDAANYSLDQVYYVSAVSGDVTGSGFPDLADPCLDIALGQPIVWRSIPTVQLNAVSDACPGDEAIATLLLSGNFPLTINYTLGGVAASQTFAASPASLRITVPATSTTLALTGVSDQYACTSSSNASVTINPLAEIEVMNLDVQCDGAGLNYTVSFEITSGDIATAMVLPAGSGTLTGAIFTSNPIPEGTAYSFTVSDANQCGTVTVADGPVNCDCISMVAPIGLDTLSVCGATPVTAVHSHAGSTLDGDDGTGYVLHSSNGTTLGTVYDQSVSPTFNIDIAGGMSFGTVYYISPAVGNVDAGGVIDLADPCLDIAMGQPIVWRSIPTVQLNAVSDACPGDEAIATLLLTGNFPLTVDYTLGGVAASQTFAASPASLRITVPATSTTLALTGVSDQYACTSSSNASVTINPLAEVEVMNLDVQCDGAGLNYTVSFEITAGDLATAMVLPAGSGTLTGAIFTSNPIPEGTSYSFTVSDANQCGTVTVADGPVNCDCISMVAPIGLDTLRVCGATPVTAVHSHAGSTLDADDGTGYILHNANGASLGTVYGQSASPTFNIDIAGGMSFGTVYYISPAVGNVDGGGMLNLADPCLSVAAGTPVIWEDGPTADLQGETVICEGGSTMITFVFTGDGPFTASMITSDGGRDTTFTTPGPTVSYFVSPTTGTIYVLTEVTTTSCTIFPNDTVRVDVDELFTAGTSTGDLTLCANDDSQIDLSSQLMSADVGGTYSMTSGPTVPSLDASTGIFQNTGLTGGQYVFDYTVGSGGVCPIDNTSITVNLTSAPTADAGQDQMLLCDETTADLGGTGSSTGAGISYAWTGGPVADPTAAQTTTTVGGTYTLTVTDAAGGCTVSEDVEIDISDDRPNTVEVVTSPVDCDGGATGSIFAGNVSGGAAPYRFSLDGSTPGLTGEFQNLSPGTYTLLITDANGCAYQEDVTIGGATPVGVGAGPDVELRFGESETIQLLTTGDIVTINWTGGPFTCLDTTFCSEITITPVVSAVYTVTVIDENGCEASDAVQIIVRRERPIYAPTAFSPNGDGVNDFFYLQSPEGIISTINTLQIFDRWGESVFLNSNLPPNEPTAGWTGFYNGEIMNPAVFVFIAEVEFTDGVVETIKGDFSLIR